MKAAVRGHEIERCVLRASQVVFLAWGGGAHSPELEIDFFLGLDNSSGKQTVWMTFCCPYTDKVGWRFPCKIYRFTGPRSRVCVSTALNNGPMDGFLGFTLISGVLAL